MQTIPSLTSSKLSKYMPILKGNVFLAPLAGFTDIAFRRLCRDYGAALTITEMVSCKGLAYGSKNTEKLLLTAPNEAPSCVQLFGSEPEFYKKALLNPILDKFDIIDINMGCPMPKVTKNGDGSALLKNIPLAAKIVETCAKFDRPVTVKCRLGWDNKDSIIDFARAMEQSGAKMLTIHGRTSEQMYRGKADLETAASVIKKVDIPIIGNGDILCAEDAKNALNNFGFAGIMLGRGAIGHPDIFSILQGLPAQKPLKLILQHLDYSLEYFDNHYTVTNLRKSLAYYLKNIPDTKALRQEINYIKDVQILKSKLINALQDQ